MAVDQEEIHKLSLSDNVDDRFEAARRLQDGPVGSCRCRYVAYFDDL